MKIEDFEGFKYPIQLATKRTKDITVELTMTACIGGGNYYEVKTGLSIKKFIYLSVAIDFYNSHDS
jgi:hypothetical protein